MMCRRPAGYPISLADSYTGPSFPPRSPSFIHLYHSLRLEALWPLLGGSSHVSSEIGPTHALPDDSLPPRLICVLSKFLSRVSHCFPS